MSKNIIIAIDGPAAAGKSSTAKIIAQKLNFVYVDTGAMYRAITYKALEKGIVEDNDAVIKMTRTLTVRLKFENGITRVFTNDVEITDKIRSTEVNSMVSQISRIPEVREEMVKIQKSLGENGNLIAEGRDTTTVVFPNANLKIYLTASVEERSERRLEEFQNKGVDTDLNEVKENIQTRDKIDSGRKVSPLKKADDAFEIDTTNLTLDEQVNIILNKVNEL